MNADLECAVRSLTFDFDAQPKHAKETLKFGATFTDHMLEVDYKAGEGWKTPLISPYHALPIDPAASALHYSLQVCCRVESAALQFVHVWKCIFSSFLAAAMLLLCLFLNFNQISCPTLSSAGVSLQSSKAVRVPQQYAGLTRSLRAVL